MQKNSTETEIRHREKQDTALAKKKTDQSDVESMANDGASYKRGVSLKSSGVGGRLSLFLCLALVVLCLLLIYNLYDVISQRDAYHEELVNLRFKYRTCDIKKLECEKKQEISKKTKETDDLRILQLEQSNSEHSSQTQDALQQLKTLETKNQDLNQQSDSFREQIKTFEAKNQELTAQVQQITEKLNDAEAKLTETNKNSETKDAELNEIKQKLANSEQELVNSKQALDSQRQTLEKTQLDLQTASQQQQTRIEHQQQEQLNPTPLHQQHNIPEVAPGGWDQLNQQAHSSLTAGSAAIEKEVHQVNRAEGAPAAVDSMVPSTELPDDGSLKQPNRLAPEAPVADKLPNHPDAQQPAPVPQSPAPDQNSATTDDQGAPPLVDDGDNGKQLKFAAQNSNTDAAVDDDKASEDYVDDQKV